MRSPFISVETPDEVSWLLRALGACLEQDIIALGQFQTALMKLQPLYRATPNLVWEREFNVTPEEFVLWHNGKWPDFVKDAKCAESRRQARLLDQRIMRERLYLMVQMLKADFDLHAEEG